MSELKSWLSDCAPYPVILGHDTLRLMPLIETMLATGETPIVAKRVSNA
jgi:hypothetical protein